jgi:ABC-type cobalamin/Fe3+-siderophores transport system ATPase subunit
VSILVVEHHMDLVRAIASHVLALQGGKSLMHGSPQQVLDSDALKEAFVGGHHDDRTVEWEGTIGAPGERRGSGGGES